jgi:hypothetical protein
MTRSAIVLICLLACTVSARFNVWEGGRWYDYGTFTNYQTAHQEADAAVSASNRAVRADLEQITNALARQLDDERGARAEAVTKGRVSWWTGFLCGIIPALSFMLGVYVAGK